MKKLVIAFALLLGSFICNGQQAQEINLNWGVEGKDKIHKFPPRVLTHDESGVYLVRGWFEGRGRYTSDIVIYHIDNDLQKIKSFHYLDKLRCYKFLIHMNGQIYLFTSHEDKEAKEVKYSYQTIDKETLQPNNDIKTFAKVDVNGKYIPYMKNNRGGTAAHYLDYRFSKDSSKILLYHVVADKQENVSVHACVFDNQLNEIWKKQIEIPYLYGNDSYCFIDGQISNQGNAFFLTKKDYSDQKNKKGFKHIVSGIFESGNQIKQYPLELEQKFPVDLVTSIDDVGFVCAGFYSKDFPKNYLRIDPYNYSWNTTEGVYFFKIDENTKNLIYETTHSFAEEPTLQGTIPQTEKFRSRLAPKVELMPENKEYRAREIFVSKNGDIILTGQKEFIAPTGTVNSPSGVVAARNIFIVAMRENGQIKYSKVVETAGSFSGKRYPYLSIMKNDSLYFFFNETFKNEMDRVPTMLVINEKGEEEKYTLHDKDGQKTSFYTEISRQITENEVIFFGKKGKKHRFVKLEF